MVLFRDKGIVFHWLMSYNSTKCSNLKGWSVWKRNDRWESNEDDTDFTIPLFIGNVFQQLYNMADTIIVGKFVGAMRWRQ